jgi:hypothetical protein
MPAVCVTAAVGGRFGRLLTLVPPITQERRESQSARIETRGCALQNVAVEMLAPGSRAKHAAAHAIVALALGLRVTAVRSVDPDPHGCGCELDSDDLLPSAALVAYWWAGVATEIRQSHGSRMYERDLKVLRVLRNRLDDNAYFHGVAVARLLIDQLRCEVEQFADALTAFGSGVLKHDALAAAFTPIDFGSHRHLIATRPTAVVRADLDPAAVGT